MTKEKTRPIGQARGSEEQSMFRLATKGNGGRKGKAESLNEPEEEFLAGM